MNQHGEVPSRKPRGRKSLALAGLTVAGLMGAGIGVLNAKNKPLIEQVAQDLRSPGLYFPNYLVPQALIGPMLRLGSFVDINRKPDHDVEITTIEGLSPDDGHPFSAQQIVPRRKSEGLMPAMVWIHGGGHLLGTPGIYAPRNARIADELGMKVFAASYRKAHEAPFPADLDDCYAVLRWVQDNAAELGIDPQRIAVCGDSAGGGLAAAVVQRAIDENHPVAFQGLVYPMLNHRTGSTAESKENTPSARGRFIWTPNFNSAAWEIYLGPNHLDGKLPDYASPFFRDDVSAMPPTWIGIGELDLFYDESRAFANRLEAAGIDVRFDVYEGAYHGFDHIAPRARTTEKLGSDLIAAMKATFNT